MERVNRALDKKQAELEERKAASLRSSYGVRPSSQQPRASTPGIAEANSRWEQRLRWIPRRRRIIKAELLSIVSFEPMRCCVRAGYAAGSVLLRCSARTVCQVING